MDNPELDRKCMLHIGLTGARRRELFLLADVLSEDGLVRAFRRAFDRGKELKRRDPGLPQALWLYLGFLLEVASSCRDLPARTARRGVPGSGEGGGAAAGAKKRHHSPKERLALSYWAEIHAWRGEGQSFAKIAKLLWSAHHKKISGDWLRKLWNERETGHGAKGEAP